ncbi:hypothetical protein ACLOJK_009104 [Asimina triloba]
MDLKWKNMDVIADGDGAAVDFNEMESHRNQRRRRAIWIAALDYFQICCRRAAVDAMIGEKKLLELNAEVALVAGFSNQRR